MKMLKKLNKDNTITKDIGVDNLQEGDNDDGEGNSLNVSSNSFHSTLDELQTAIDNVINWWCHHYQ